MRLRAYGLDVLCHGSEEIKLPSATRQPCDVAIELGSLPIQAREACGWTVYYCPADLGLGITIRKSPDGSLYYIAYDDGTEFMADSDGRRVWARWPPELSVEDTLTYVHGPVLGIVLRLRGVVCLHASVVGIGGRAVAFAGPAEAGKSTAAAVFHERGASVLSDDVLALKVEGDSFLAQPGWPHLKLWPESAEALYGARDALPRLTPTWDKLMLDLAAPGARFQTEPLPLAAIYILGERSGSPGAPRVERIPPREALMALVGNVYACRMFDREMRVREIELLARLCQRVPVRRLIPHENIGFHSRIHEVVMADLARERNQPGGAQPPG